MSEGVIICHKKSNNNNKTQPTDLLSPCLNPGYVCVLGFNFLTTWPAINITAYCHKCSDIILPVSNM